MILASRPPRIRCAAEVADDIAVFLQAAPAAAVLMPHGTWEAGEPDKFAALWICKITNRYNAGAARSIKGNVPFGTYDGINGRVTG